MPELGLSVPFWVIALIWLAKVVLLVFISAVLAWLGVKAFLEWPYSISWTS